jgi:hypothetical protein
MGVPIVNLSPSARLCRGRRCRRGRNKLRGGRRRGAILSGSRRARAILSGSRRARAILSRTILSRSHRLLGAKVIIIVG